MAARIWASPDTFLIDANGVIARVWTKVKVKGHAQEVLEAATALVQGK